MLAVHSFEVVTSFDMITSSFEGTNSVERLDESNFKPLPYAAIRRASALPAIKKIEFEKEH